MSYPRSYIKGSFNRRCDRCGFWYKAEQTKKEWTGLIVCSDCWEVRHPQEFVRGIPDKMNAPEPRPELTDNYSVQPIGSAASYLIYYPSTGGIAPILANGAFIIFNSNDGPLAPSAG